MTTPSQLIVAASLAASHTRTAAQDVTFEQARALLEPFYSALDLPGGKDVRPLIENALAANWVSYSGENDSKGREAFVSLVQGLGRTVPDMHWQIKEMLVSGNRVVVRSLATGTPQGQFMGMTTTGMKSFSIMAIDIHTIVDGKSSVVYHVEDWASAIRQVKP